MFKSIIDFYRVSQAKPCNGGALSSNSLSSDFRPEDRRRVCNGLLFLPPHWVMAYITFAV